MQLRSEGGKNTSDFLCEVFSSLEPITGVGKTFVLASVRASPAQSGRQVPSRSGASGADWDGQQWVSGDTLVLADAIGANESERTAITPWALPEPTAPSVAARSAGIQLSIPELAQLGSVSRRCC